MAELLGAPESAIRDVIRQGHVRSRDEEYIGIPETVTCSREARDRWAEKCGLSRWVLLDDAIGGATVELRADGHFIRFILAWDGVLYADTVPSRLTGSQGPI